MSAPAAAGGRRESRIPAWLRPRDSEPRHRDLPVIEAAVLIVVGLLLAVATVNDVARQVHINDRLVADLRTWRTYTGHDYHNVAVDRELLGPSSKRDVVCGNDAPGAPRAKVQVCLIVEGATRAGRRRVSGGWYLPPQSEFDVKPLRYGCFGPAAAGFCPR